MDQIYDRESTVTQASTKRKHDTPSRKSSNKKQTFDGYMETSLCISQEFVGAETKGKILVVDDYVENFIIIDGFLMVLGFEGRQENVTNVNNGKEAIKEIQRAFEEKDPTRFSLIMVECKMSLIDGYETIKRIRGLY